MSSLVDARVLMSQHFTDALRLNRPEIWVLLQHWLGMLAISKVNILLVIFSRG